MTVIRPADANETAQAWRAALHNESGPTALALTRQNLPIYDREADGLGRADGVLQGGYVFYENAPNGLDMVLIGAGSELDIAYEAAKELAAEGVGVRVVSLPSWELFAHRMTPIAKASGRRRAQSRSKPASPSAGSAGLATIRPRALSSASITLAPAARTSGSTRNLA